MAISWERYRDKLDIVDVLRYWRRGFVIWGRLVDLTEQASDYWKSPARAADQTEERAMQSKVLRSTASCPWTSRSSYSP